MGLLASRSTLWRCSLTDRSAIKRLLERLGFVHVAGWVRKEDAPAIRRKIEKTRPQVEALREWGEDTG